MLTMEWSALFIVGLIAIGFFVGFGWTLGAWIMGALLGALKRGG